MLTIRVEPHLKRSAQQVAKELGFTISALVHGYLKLLVKTKAVSFSAEESEEPSEYLIAAIKEAEENRKAGRYVSFDDPKKALAFLDRVIAKKKNRAR